MVCPKLYQHKGFYLPGLQAVKGLEVLVNVHRMQTYFTLDSANWGEPTLLLAREASWMKSPQHLLGGN